MENNDYYEEVGFQQIMDQLSNQTLIIDNNVIDEINKMSIWKIYNYDGDELKKLSLINNRLEITIYQFFDEWFFIQSFKPGGYYLKYFKCDQLDGLIKCLEDLYSEFL